MGMEDAAKRIAEKLQGKPTVEGIAQLPQSQWSSLQLAIDHLRAERLTAQGVLKHYTQSRFVHPGTLRPGDVCRVEAALLDLAEVCGFEPVLLSPVAPFGSCSVFGCVDQNNVLGAGRGVEVMADPTNALAFEIADRIKSGRADPGKEMHLCAAARVVRGQMFSGEGMLPHFGIFCLVSRGRDSVGSYGCEKALLRAQMRCLWTLYGKEMTIVLRKRGGYADGAGFLQAMETFLREEFPEVSLQVEDQEEDNAYYKGLNFKIYRTAEGKTFEVGDGGFVNWMEQLTGNRKERCLISGIGLDRILLMDEADTLFKLEKDLKKQGGTP